MRLQSAPGWLLNPPVVWCQDDTTISCARWHTTSGSIIGIPPQEEGCMGGPCLLVGRHERIVLDCNLPPACLRLILNIVTIDRKPLLASVRVMRSTLDWYHVTLPQRIGL